jgi:phosphatidylethanolamine/phosphatidyl-N-methylethanolamine N-methyltransferase
MNSNLSSPQQPQSTEALDLADYPSREIISPMVDPRTWRNTLAWTKQILTHPRQMGAVVPSSKQLAEAMVRAAKLNHLSRVIELGPGTGVITRALLQFGLDPSRIHALERDVGMADQLRKNHPGLDVRSVSLTDPEAVTLLNLSPAPVIVSSLPWRAFTLVEATAIAKSISQLSERNGILVQYTYGSAPPIPESIVDKLGWRGCAVERVWRNLPPAMVWSYAPAST